MSYTIEIDDSCDNAECAFSGTVEAVERREQISLDEMHIQHDWTCPLCGLEHIREDWDDI